jgi:hypothetical protein
MARRPYSISIVPWRVRGAECCIPVPRGRKEASLTCRNGGKVHALPLDDMGHPRTWLDVPPVSDQESRPTSAGSNSRMRPSSPQRQNCTCTTRGAQDCAKVVVRAGYTVFLGRPGMLGPVGQLGRQVGGERHWLGAWQGLGSVKCPQILARGWRTSPLPTARR